MTTELNTKPKFTVLQIIKGIPKVIEAIIKKRFAPKHIKEQVVLRTILAKRCVLEGNCVSCGCSMWGIEDKRYANVACDKFYLGESDYCYKEFLSKEQWEEQKKIIAFEVFEKIAKQINEDAKQIRKEKYAKEGIIKRAWYELHEYFN